MTINKQIRDFVRDLEGAFKDTNSKNKLKQLGTIAIKMIQTRTRKGFGVSKPGGVTRKLDRLSRSYIEQRKRMRLSPHTTATKSNLTRSGRMLASLRTTVSNGKVIVKPTGRSREGIPNEKVAEFAEDNGRPFLNLSAIETQKILKEYQKNLERNLKKL